MKKLLLTSIVSAIAFVCFAQPARVQIINNSPDSLYRMVDIYIEAALEVNDLMYKGATPYKDIMYTGTPVRITISPFDKPYPLDTLYSTVTTLNPGGSYVFVLNGTKEQARYNPAMPLRLDIYNGAKETASNPAETDILFAHGSTDLGTSDIRVGFSLIENNLSFSSFGSGYKTFQTMIPPPAQRVLRLTNANGNKTISAFMFQLMPFVGKAIVAMPSGFVTPNQNRNGTPLSFIAVTPAGQVMDFGVTSSDITRMQFIHNSADASTSSVDVYIDDSLAFNNVSFRNASPFLDILAGTNFTLGVAPSNSTAVDDTFYSADMFLDADKNYIGVLSGIKSTIGYSPMKPLNLAIYDQGREEGTSSSMVDVLVFHGATDAPDIDIQNSSNTVLINDLGYGEFSDYIQLAPAPGLIKVTDATGNLLRQYNAILTGFGGQAGTVVASGFFDTAANNNGPRFGLYLAPPTGGGLIPLPEVTVGVNDVEPNNSIVKIFPNPAADRLFILGSLSANATAVICDMTGKQVKQITNTSKGIDLADISSGLYILKVQDGGTIYHQKFSRQ